jgi:alanine dehydrogenase
MSKEVGLRVEVVEKAATALKNSDVCVTCTPSRRPILNAQDIAPGTFIAAVGADSPHKQELDPELLRQNKVVVDLLDQCAEVGELHHALEQGMRREDVHGELGEIILGKKARTRISGRDYHFRFDRNIAPGCGFRSSGLRESARGRSR